MTRISTKLTSSCPTDEHREQSISEFWSYSWKGTSQYKENKLGNDFLSRELSLHFLPKTEN
jgi:hypothetical protein